MKSIFLSLFVIVFSIIGCKSEQGLSYQEAVLNNNIDKINEIDSLIQKLIASKRTAGIQFGVQIGNAEPIIKVYGLASLEDNRKVKLNDQFRIASITKPFTGTAVLKLIELGRISLDDSIDKFFPEYPNGKNISIYQLLSHTSGIPNWWDGEMQKDVPENFPMCDNPHQYLQEMNNNSLFEPGEYFSYSNSGYVLLGEIIEKVSGQTYESFLQEHIFEPAEMTHTEMEYIEKKSDGWAKGYALGAGKDVPFVEPEVYHLPFSAGGLRSTAADLMKFIMALNTGKIIKQEMVTKMTSNANLNSGKPVYEGFYQFPNPKENINRRGYGLGFNLMELYGTSVFYHSGGIAGFNSYLMHIPKNNTTLVFLANTEDGIVPLLKEIWKISTEFEK